MKVTDIVLTANQNLRRSKLRTFLTVFAISIGSFTLALSLGLGEGVRSYITSQLGDFNDVNLYVVQEKGGNFGPNPFSANEPREFDPNEAVQSQSTTGNLFTQADADRLAAIDGVDQVRLPYPATFSYFVGQNDTKYKAQAEQYVPEIPVRLLSGTTIDQAKTDGTVMSRRFLTAIGVQNPDDAIGKKIDFFYATPPTGELKKATLEVVGVFEPALGDLPFKINESLARNIALEQKETADLLFGVMFASRDKDISEEEFKANLDKKNLQAISIAEFNAFLNNIITGIQIALAIFSSIAIFASIVGVVNTLFMAVLERTREIGLYRALGAKQKTIFMLFAVEAAFDRVLG